MLGFGFSKILLLALVVGGVWFVFRYLTALGQMQARVRAANQAAAAARAAEEGREAQRTTAIEAEEMTACKRCGTYVSATRPAACNRVDCPYRR